PDMAIPQPIAWPPRCRGGIESIADPRSFTSTSLMDQADVLVWVSFFAIAASFYVIGRLLTYLACFVPSRRFRRAPAGAPWHELARLAWPARRLGSVAAVFPFVALAAVILADVTSPGRRLPPAAWLGFIVAAWIGILQNQLHWSRRINPVVWSL